MSLSATQSKLMLTRRKKVVSETKSLLITEEYRKYKDAKAEIMRSTDFGTPEQNQKLNELRQLYNQTIYEIQTL